MKKSIPLILISFVLFNSLCAERLTQLDLSGTWQVRLDRDKQGVEEQWWQDEFDDTLQLPGSLTAQGYGDAVDLNTPWIGDVRQEAYADPRYESYKAKEQFKYPFWLQPAKYFRGLAWYQREINIPEEWKNKRIVLYLERTHWTTSVWVNDKKVGTEDSLSTPHVYDLTDVLSAGKQKLTILVDNTIDLNVGVNSHSVSDHTQGNWNGIVGEMMLYAAENEWIEDVQVYPDVEKKQAMVRITLANHSGRPTGGHLELKVFSDDESSCKTIKTAYEIAGETPVTQEVIVPLGQNVKLWDEFDPALYQLSVKQVSVAGKHDEFVTAFGMRSVAVKGTQITINDRPIFLRGTLECSIFPKTGHPPTDVKSWKKVIQTCKDFGLNHMRFHSWCPPEAAFIAADELGFYLQVECASWANQGATVGDGTPLDKWLYSEAEKITKVYGNHPSFIMMAYGNEPAGEHQKAYLNEWCDYWKEHEPRRIHTSGAGWPLVKASDFNNLPDGVRIQAWGEELNSVINAEPPQTQFDFSAFLLEHPDKPTVSHEIGQWCVYPNFSEMKKYTGLLKPRNFEVFWDFLQTAQMGDQAHDFLMASGKLQALCYKHDIEAALRTRGFGGFQLLDLHDFPGQGTALIGILDPFWEEKGYITAEEHSLYCAPTVPLARIEKMIWTSDETFEAEVEIAHFGAESIKNALVKWSLKTPDDSVIATGIFKKQTLPTGQNSEVGKIKTALAHVQEATKVVLEVEVSAVNARNTWDLWVYPPRIQTKTPESVHVTSLLDQSAMEVLDRGGKVILMVPPEKVKTDVEIGFSSIFWNTAWTGGQAPHTLGVLCYPEHPALQRFPTDFHSNWQWWDLITHSATMEMDAFPRELRPIVQIVPDWFNPKRLGLIFEVKVGKGRLLVSSIDLTSNLEERPVAQQMLSSLYAYVNSPAFQPSETLSAEQIYSLFNEK